MRAVCIRVSSKALAIAFPEDLPGSNSSLVLRRKLAGGLCHGCLQQQGGTSQKLVAALGLPSAGHGSTATAHIPPVLIGYGGMQAHLLALGESRKLHGEENKNAQLRFSS